jgi:MYXO-CTERM domain-containing protein
MNTAIAPVTTDACGYGTTKLSHARCAVATAFTSYAGRVNFGLASFPHRATGCSGACFTGCTTETPPGDNSVCGPITTDTTLGVSVHAGGYVRTPITKDHYWLAPPDASNVASLVAQVDNNCTGSVEIYANGNSSIGGSLFSARKYLGGAYNDPFTATAVASPLGTLAEGERSCRPLDIVLIVDGIEGCDTTYNTGTYSNGEGLAVAEAGLLNAGVTFGSQTFSVKTHVIVINGDSAAITSANNIAAAGGTGSALLASNSGEIDLAFSTIIGAKLAGETCDNADNNCNGCVDEGFRHYMDVGQSCVTWSTDPERTAALTAYRNSITPSVPTGNLALLPCTTAAQAASSSTWLCYNPSDACDEADNNGYDGADENQSKCGDPAHCPTAEVCNGKDDNCNGVADEGGVCSGSCTYSAEVCNGCDDDCDGSVDEGTTTAACGIAGTPGCSAVVSCQSPVSVTPGTCSAGRGYNACSVTTQGESCDSLDNNCDGSVDNAPPMACVPSGTSNTLVYGGTSRCVMGTQVCGSSCAGFVGPIAEVCDGVDNDCNGTVDDNAGDTAGDHVGEACCRFGGRCGRGACTAGSYACSGSTLECVGGTGPAAETCNTVDDDCDGVIDNVIGRGGACTTTAGTPGQMDCDGSGAALVCVDAAACPTGDTDAGVGDDAGATDDAGTSPKSGDGGCGCETGGSPSALLVVLVVGFLLRRRRRGALVVAASCAATLLGCTDPVHTDERSQHLTPSCETCGDTQIDPANCGACGVACNVANASPRCIAGQCFVATCNAGFIDLDGLPANGCEVGCTPSGAETCNNADDDCNGIVDDGFAKMTDPTHCGSACTDCNTLGANGIWTCASGSCQLAGCAAGYIDVAADALRCEKTCTYVSATELCNNSDDDCDGKIDEGVVAPPTSQVCGTNPGATSAECTTAVAVTCTAGVWSCAFPAAVCSPTCASTTEICDTLDNNCDGRLNETTPLYGQACESDDGLPPPGHGRCRTAGTYQCTSDTTVACSAAKADCNLLSGGCTEECDGIDNDCDGLVDEPSSSKGSVSAFFVKPAVVKIAAATWIFAYEASRANGSPSVQGIGNGYATSGPVGATLDRTPACSVSGRLPWTRVTPDEAEQACSAIGGTVCSTADWQTACRAMNSCKWGYAPRGSSCTSPFTAGKFCNLAASYDFDAAIAGMQQGLLATASPTLAACSADWGSLLGQGVGTGLFDLTGNVAELTRNATSDYRAMGGSSLMESDSGASCTQTADVITDRRGDTGFRCCFSNDPRL